MRALIEDGGVHLLDGAMGTLLYSRGVFVNVCYDELNLSRPDLVRQIHREYVDAGAEVIETNTFGANPIKLSAYGLEERTEEINETAARLAVSVIEGTGAYVAGAIGPLGIRIEPWGPTSLEEARAAFGRQIAGLVAGGVDGLILETFSDLAELRCAVSAAREACDLPILAQMTVGRDRATQYGANIEEITAELAAMDADVIGLNCSVGPAIMLDAIDEMADRTSRPLIAQPNAGLPRTVHDRKMYLASPEYMAQYAARMVEAGARFVGGCCGTTPEHVAATRLAIRSLGPTQVSTATPRERSERSGAAEPIPLGERSRFGSRLESGERTVTVEILPPLGWDPDEIVAPARALAEAGIDAVSIVENARSRSRVGALAAAMIVEREVGLEAVVHYTCRDKNMLGMISDLLGAAAAGIRNILVVSGDPPVTGPYNDATAVFDIDSIGLTNVVQGLNRGLDPAGTSIGAPTRFVQGVALNQSAVDLEREISRFRYKIEAGADFVVTQPVFDLEPLERFLDAVGPISVPVIAGIYPFASARNAEFLAHELPGMHVPADTVDRMRAAQQFGEESARAEGTTIALEMIEAAKSVSSGIHLSAPARDVERAREILDAADLIGTG